MGTSVNGYVGILCRVRPAEPLAMGVIDSSLFRMFSSRRMVGKAKHPPADRRWYYNLYGSFNQNSRGSY